MNKIKQGSRLVAIGRVTACAGTGGAQRTSVDRPYDGLSKQLSSFFFLFKVLFIHLREREREREHEQRGEAEGEGEADSLLDAELDPRTRRS